MATQNNEPDGRSASVYIPTPFGLVGQWLQTERWRTEDRTFCRELGIGLNDWEGRWAMLNWVTERVIEDHEVANRQPRNYLQDVSLEYHLTFWFLTARLCYDTMAFLTVQMAVERDRGKLSPLSFNDLLRDRDRPSFQEGTNHLLSVIRESEAGFEELKQVRDKLVHFVGRAGNVVEPPKRINVTIPNNEGVLFTVETSRFADMYGTVDKWPVVDTLQKHARHIYETASKLECCFLDHNAQERVPGSYWGISRAMFDFLDCKSWHDYSPIKWEKGFTTESQDNVQSK